MNHTADVADNILRISMDAKAIVKVGPFARGEESGPSRCGGPRFSARGDGDACRHLAPDVGSSCLCTASPPK